MFYNFNRHKQKNAQPLSLKADELASMIADRCKALQRKFTDYLGEKVSQLPVSWQRIGFSMLLVAGAGYCIYLILPGTNLKSSFKMFQASEAISKTIQIEPVSPKQQAFENYLDSLKMVFIADSINQSQQNSQNHADESTHP